MKFPIALTLTLIALLSVATAQTKKKTVKPKPAPVSQTKTTVVVPVSLLTKQEQALLDEINLARANPTAYIRILQEYRTYYRGNIVLFPDGRSLITNEGVTALDDAIAYLRTLKSAPAFEVRKGMVLSAKLHLDDMLKSGRDGHLGSDGSKPEDRLNRFGSWQDSVGEDIVYDSRTPRNDVIGLIIDDGVASRGHRKNLFKPGFKVIGISLGQPVMDKTRCVITFAGDFIDKPDSKTPTATRY
jgi:uncharacterized protein YkwD